MNYAETSGFFGLLAISKNHKNADEDEGKPRQEQIVLGGFNLVRSKKNKQHNQADYDEKVSNPHKHEIMASGASYLSDFWLIITKLAKLSKMASCPKTY